MLQFIFSHFNGSLGFNRFQFKITLYYCIFTLLLSMFLQYNGTRHYQQINDFTVETNALMPYYNLHILGRTSVILCI